MYLVHSSDYIHLIFLPFYVSLTQEVITNSAVFGSDLQGM